MHACGTFMVVVLVDEAPLVDYRRRRACVCVCVCVDEWEGGCVEVAVADTTAGIHGNAHEVPHHAISIAGRNYITTRWTPKPQGTPVSGHLKHPQR